MEELRPDGAGVEVDARDRARRGARRVDLANGVDIDPLPEIRGKRRGQCVGDGAALLFDELVANGGRGGQHRGPLVEGRDDRVLRVERSKQIRDESETGWDRGRAKIGSGASASGRDGGEERTAERKEGDEKRLKLHRGSRKGERTWGRADARCVRTCAGPKPAPLRAGPLVSGCSSSGCAARLSPVGVTRHAHPLPLTILARNRPQAESQ